MAIQESPIPPQVISIIVTELAKLVIAQRNSGVATLTSAIVASTGRPVSIEDILQITEDISWSLYPDHRNGRYQEWIKTKDEGVKKVQA